MAASAGMQIARRSHPRRVRAMVVGGPIQAETDTEAAIRIEAGDTRTETATEDSVVLVTQGEEHPELVEMAAED